METISLPRQLFVLLSIYFMSVGLSDISSLMIHDSDRLCKCKLLDYQSTRLPSKWAPIIKIE